MPTPHNISISGMIGLLLLVLGGCAQSKELTHKALGKGIADHRASGAEAWCPTFVTFNVTPQRVKCGETVSLEMTATAPHVDTLAYLWEIEGQTFETGHHATWQTPGCDTIGELEKVYTVRGVVSEGECSVTRAVEVTVTCDCAFDAMVNFAFAKAQLDPTAQTILDEFAAKLQNNPTSSILIEGHTDNVGRERKNTALGRKRAEAVKAYLIRTWHIAPDRLITRSFGEDAPIASNASPTGRAKNRRAEVFRILLTTHDAAAGSSK